MKNNIDKLFEEGVELYEQEKLDEAETKFVEALRLDSDSDEIKYNLALVYLEKKEYDRANFLVSQIKEIDCNEILDELEKVDFEATKGNPFEQQRITESEYFKERIDNFQNILNDESLPKLIRCEFCDGQIELSEIERQNIYYNCPHCKSQSNVLEKERELEIEFQNKLDSELFEILIDSQNFRLEFLLAAKKEIKRRNIKFDTNDEFREQIRKFL